MIFICYVFQEDRDVPYMEAAPSRTLDEARTFAASLLDRHDDTVAVEITEDDIPLERIERAQ